MKESQSLTNNLLIEVDNLSNRLRNIKQSYKTTENKALKGRLISKLRSSELLIAPIGTQTVSVAPSFIETSPL